MNIKKIACGALGAALLLSATACSAVPVKNAGDANASQLAAQAEKFPKYVFLFIGDGMSYPQFQAASDYLGALADKDYVKALPSNSYEDRAGAVLDGPKALNFMDFDVAGSAVTYDSCSFAPDSASTATSIATGYKTYSGMINVDTTGSTSYETIAEKLHSQKDWKVGIISSVNLNHATPAAFYAHQASRNNYYEIGEELVNSGFEYFAGGGLKKVTGPEKDKTSLYDLAADAGYKVTYTQADAEAVTAADEKVILIDEHLADSDAMDYEMDRKSGEWALADYVKKGIEVLDNDTGFFMMCEGGKIDWAGHANDAATSIYDTIALSDAVQVALDFAAAHPGECLIIVTADHETGGMTIGFATTAYDTHFQYLQNQKTSFTAFDDVISELKESGATFEDAMAKVEELYGLTTKEGEALSLTATDVESLRKAWNVAMGTQEIDKAEASLLYGGYNPFSMAVSHIMNNKAGLSYTSYAHTGLQIPVYAYGVGAEKFSGLYDNTGIFTRTMDAMGLTPDAE